jgi:hypothetical protein
VWYPREQQHKILQLDPLLRSWEVLLEAPDNDWRWECKWRIVRSSPPTVALTELRLAGLLAGDQLWSGFVTSTASPPIPDNQDRIISSRRYLLDCRVIGGTAPRSNCCPQPRPVLPHQPGLPLPNRIRSPVRQRAKLPWKIRLQWKKRYPIRYRIFRGSRIFHDLPGASRTTARWRTTTHTGITAGPGHHAGAGAEHDIEVTGRTEHLSNAQ